MDAILPILANVEWPSAIVAVFLLVCPTAVLIVAVVRYGIDEVTKLSGYFTGFLGLLFGTFGTYFFTEKTTQAKIQAVQAQSATELGTAFTAFKAASQFVKPKLSPEDAKLFGELIFTPAMVKALRETPTPDLKGSFPFHPQFKYKSTPSPSPSE